MSRLQPPAGLPDDTEVAFASRLNSVGVHLIRRLHREDEALGITPARLSALSVLVFGGPHSLRALAADEGVSAPTMSRIVAALDAEGLARRSPDRDDARAIQIVATAKGRRVMERGRSLRVQALAAELRSFAPKDVAALERALPLLERLASEAVEAPPG